MREAIPPLLQYAFMAWCSVKAQGQLYFYITFTLARPKEVSSVLTVARELGSVSYTWWECRSDGISVTLN
jgi:hypothetical protein